MDALLLAAGVGRRLSAAHEQPKCLLQIAGRSLLEQHIENLNQLGVERIGLCLGYQSEQIVEALATIESEASLLIHYNPLFRQGSVVSLWCLRQLLNGGNSVLLMDADVLYSAQILARLVKSPQPNCYLIDRDFEPGDEPVKICLRQQRIVEFRKQLAADLDYDTIGESVGFFKFDAPTAALLAQMCAQTIASGLGDLPHEEVLRALALDGNTDIGIEDVSGLPWIEIDFPQDITKAQEQILPRIHQMAELNCKQ